MKYIIILSREIEPDIATSIVTLKVNEYIQKGFIPAGNLSVVFDKYDLCYVAQAMIKRGKKDELDKR